MKTIRFIPANTNVVVRNLKANTPAVQHTTKKELILVDGEPQTAFCPLTGDEVSTITRDGFALYFNPFRVRTRFEVEASDVDEKLLGEQLSKIQYDVPARTGFSPCNRLYQLAVPTTESVWLVRSGDVPWNFLGEMEDMGCKVDVDMLDPSETRKNVGKAIAFLQAKLNEKISNAEDSMREALTELEGSEEAGIDEEKALKKYKARASAIESRLNKMSKDITEGVRRFGIVGQSFGLSRLSQSASMFRAAMNEQAQAYKRGVQVLAQSTSTDAQLLAQQAAADQLPAGILSDAIREFTGDDETADAINEAFTGQPETFSLTDAEVDG